MTAMSSWASPTPSCAISPTARAAPIFTGRAGRTGGGRLGARRLEHPVSRRPVSGRADRSDAHRLRPRRRPRRGRRPEKARRSHRSGRTDARRHGALQQTGRWWGRSRSPTSRLRRCSGAGADCHCRSIRGPRWRFCATRSPRARPSPRCSHSREPEPVRAARGRCSQPRPPTPPVPGTPGGRGSDRSRSRQRPASGCPPPRRSPREGGRSRPLHGPPGFRNRPRCTAGHRVRDAP